MIKLIVFFSLVVLVSCGKSSSGGGAKPKELDIQFQVPRSRDNYFVVPVRMNNRSFFVRKGGSKAIEQADRRLCRFGIEPGRYHYEIDAKKLFIRSGDLTWQLNSATIYDRTQITGSWRGDIRIGQERFDVTLRFLGEELTVIFNCR